MPTEPTMTKTSCEPSREKPSFIPFREKTSRYSFHRDRGKGTPGWPESPESPEMTKSGAILEKSRAPKLNLRNTEEGTERARLEFREGVQPCEGGRRDSALAPGDFALQLNHGLLNSIAPEYRRHSASTKTWDPAKEQRDQQKAAEIG
jgi:hypothetical protein